MHYLFNRQLINDFGTSVQTHVYTVFHKLSTQIGKRKMKKKFLQTTASWYQTFNKLKCPDIERAAHEILTVRHD